MTIQDAHFTWDDDPAQTEPFLVCDRCESKLCTIEEGDALSVIASVVSDHRGHAHECDDALREYERDFKN